MIRTNRMFYKIINKQLINVTQMDKDYYIDMFVAWMRIIKVTKFLN